MAHMTMIEAIRDAHDICMERDEKVVVFGEDVGYFGGVFRCTKGLQEKFGRNRCFDAPINESGIVGTATYYAPDWRPLLPWLIWGQSTHVGKNVVKGCGIYQLQAYG